MAATQHKKHLSDRRFVEFPREHPIKVRLSDQDLAEVEAAANITHEGKLASYLYDCAMQAHRQREAARKRIADPSAELPPEMMVLALRDLMRAGLRHQSEHTDNAA